MASHASAEKRARQTVRRTARNLARLSRVRTAIRAFRRAVQDNDTANLDAAFMAASRELRVAGSKGVLHARNVSRRVSRLAAAHKKAKA